MTWRRLPASLLASILLAACTTPLPPGARADATPDTTAAPDPAGDPEDAAQRRDDLLNALQRARQGERDQALRDLHDLHPSGTPSPDLPREDAPDALALLAEAHAHAGDFDQALVALSWLFQLSPQHPELRRYAFARALAIARAHLTPDQRRAYAEHADDLLAAAAGAAELLDAPTPFPDDLRPRLASLAERVQPTLLRLGEPALADEIAQRASATAPKERVVGALLPLTGPDRAVGAAALRGLLLAQSAFRDDASPRLTLAFYDTRSTPEGAREGVAALARQGATVILGPLSNTEARAAADAAPQHNIPLITLSLDRSTPNPPRGVFRLFINPAREVEALLLRARDAGRQRLVILYPDLPFAREIVELAREQTRRDGTPALIHALPYDPAKPDFARLAAQAARANPDAILIPDTGARVTLLLPFLAAEHLWCTPHDAPTPPAPAQGEAPRVPITCLGNATWLDPSLLRDGATYLQGATIAASWATASPAEPNARLLREHRALLGGDPDLFAAFAFDALRLARRAILQHGLDTPERFARGLSGLPPADGLTGPLRVLPSGDIQGPLILQTVRGERLHLLSDAPQP